MDSKNSKQAKRQSARGYVLSRLSRPKAKPTSARKLGEAIVERQIIGGKYALANARKAIYSMEARGELKRSEDGLYSLAEGFDPKA